MVIKACMDSNKSNTHDGHIFNKVRIYCASTLLFSPFKNVFHRLMQINIIFALFFQ